MGTEGSTRGGLNRMSESGTEGVDGIQVNSNRSATREYSIKVKTFPRFSGAINERKAEFLRTFEQHCNLYEMSEEERLRLVPLILDGEALMWFNSLGPVTKWKDFERRFRNQYVRMGYRQYVLKELNEMWCGDKDNLRKYFYDKVGLFDELGDYISSLEKIDQITKGLSLDIRKQMVIGNCHTLDDMQEMIARIEDLNLFPRNEGETRSKDVEQKTTGDKRCYECGQLGHIKARCPVRITRSGTYGVDTKGRIQNLPSISAVISNRIFHMVIDSGSSVSIISRDIIDDLQGIELRSIPPVTGYTVNGPVTFSQECTIDFKHQNRKFRHVFTVLPGRETDNLILLGMTFLQEWGAIINCKTGEVEFANKINHNTGENQNVSSRVNGSTGVFRDDREEREFKRGWEQLREEYDDVFTVNPRLSNFPSYDITMTSYDPVQKPPYRVPYSLRNQVKEFIDEMVRNKVIARAGPGLWQQPAMVIPKKDGGIRVVTDFRLVNNKTVSLANCIPTIDSALDTIREHPFVSIMDLSHGYYQVGVTERTSEILTFSLNGERFKYLRLPQGFSNSGAYFTSCLAELTRACPGVNMVCYIDDIAVSSPDAMTHLRDLRAVLNACRKYRISVNPNKVQILPTDAKFLGQVISDNRMEIVEDKTKAVKDFQRPKNIRGLRRWLGLTNYYRKFIKNYGDIIHPLLGLLKKSIKWKWTEECEQAFIKLKELLCSSPVLMTPRMGEAFYLQTDASAVAVGATLSQRDEATSEYKPVAYFSKHLNGSQQRYSTIEREMFAIMAAIKHFGRYLYGRKITILTDHRPITSLYLKPLAKVNSPRLLNWLVKLQEYDVEILYVPGEDNGAADSLSRDGKYEKIPLNLLYDPTVNENRSEMEERVRKAQREENQWANIIKFLSEGETEPGWNENCARDYTMKRGLLWRKARKIDVRDEPSDEVTETLVVPKSLVQQILMIVHDAPNSLHAGFKGTLKRTKALYYWPMMHREIKAYVASCKICQKCIEYSHQRATQMGQIMAGKRLAVVSIDLVGPLPRGAGLMEHVVTMVDVFSRYTVLEPVRSTTTNEVIRVMERFIKTFGAPKVLISDNATNFTSRRLEKYCHENGIEQRFIAAYQPQNNICERYNKTFKNALRKYVNVGGGHKQWVKYVGKIQAGINSSYNESLGCSANKLMFGQDLRIPSNLNIDSHDIPTNLPTRNEYAEFQEALDGKLKNLTAMSREKLRESQGRNARQEKGRRVQREFQVGELIMVRKKVISSRDDGLSGKLSYRWTGPVRIAERISKWSYRLEDPESGSNMGRRHVNHLRKYVERISHEEKANEVIENQGGRNKGNPQEPGAVRRSVRHRKLGRFAGQEWTV